jgi:hypothetical protein
MEHPVMAFPPVAAVCPALEFSLPWSISRIVPQPRILTIDDGQHAHLRILSAQTRFQQQDCALRKRYVYLSPNSNFLSCWTPCSCIITRFVLAALVESESERMRSLGGLGTEFGVFGWVNRPGLFDRHIAHQQGPSQAAFDTPSAYGVSGVVGLVIF